MPVIQKVAKEIFKTKPIIAGNPDVSISMGAAFYCLFRAEQAGNIKLSAAQEKKVLYLFSARSGKTDFEPSQAKQGAKT